MKKKKAKAPLKTRMMIGVGSFIFFLCLLEIAMRLIAGVLVEGEEMGGPKDAPKILCVGDSYTYGGGGTRQESYPAQLQKRLDAEPGGKKYAVINAGQCEGNTEQALYDFPAQIEKYKPEVVVLLIGSANRFNAWTEKYHDSALKNAGKGLFGDLKVVKMARIIWLNLRSREARRSRGLGEMFSPYDVVDNHYDAHQDYIESRWIKVMRLGDKETDDPALNLWKLIRAEKFDDARQLLAKNADGDVIENAELLYAALSLNELTGGLERVSELLEANAAAHGEEKEFLNARAYYYRRIAMKYKEAGDFGPAVKYFLKAIEYDPDVFHSHYYLAKIYDLQSAYQADWISAELQRIKDKTPERATAGYVLLSSYIEFYGERLKNEKGIEERLRSDLEKMAELCERNGIKLIVMNYPVSYPMANEQLKDLAEERRLPFIDNRAAFSQLQPVEKYLLDDDHCTPAGHAVIVDNVIAALKSQNLIQ